MFDLSLIRGKPSIGLDIGTNTLRVAQFRQAADKPLFFNYGQIATPAGAVAEGEILDPEAVAVALKSLWRETNLSDRRVVIGVANQKVVVRLIQLPYMEKSEIQSALRFQAQEYIPIPIEEAILDFEIVGEIDDEQRGRLLEILLVAAKKDMVDNYIKALEEAGLRPEIIDVSSLAFTRAVLNGDQEFSIDEAPEAKTALALVDVGGGLTNIAVMERGTPRFARISGIGGNAFTEALVENLKIGFKEAEELKKKIGLKSPESEEASQDNDEEIAPEMADLIKPTQEILADEMTKFLTELRRSIDYYLAQATQIKRIERIMLSGGGARMKNFAQHLADWLQIEVAISEPFKHIRVDKRLAKNGLNDKVLALTMCVGLALRGLEE